MLILGSPRDEFEHYDDNVAKEFSFVDEEIYRSVRRGFFQKYSELKLFNIPEVEEEYGGQARENMLYGIEKYF